MALKCCIHFSVKNIFILLVIAVTISLICQGLYIHSHKQIAQNTAKNIACRQVFTDSRQYIEDRPRSEFEELQMIYFVTSTYPRIDQIARLTSLAHTLMHVPRLHWIVANYQGSCNPFLDNFLNKFGLPFTHLSSLADDSQLSDIANRRWALQWLHSRNITSGVLYFAEEYNSYDLRIFSEIRGTQRVSMFPVSLRKSVVNTPIVVNGTVVGFLHDQKIKRNWPVNVAGYAVNLAYLRYFPDAHPPYETGIGGDLFLKSIDLGLELIEPKARNCTEVLVWQTETWMMKSIIYHLSDYQFINSTNLPQLFTTMEAMGGMKLSNVKGKKLPFKWIKPKRSKRIGKSIKAK